MTQDSEHDLRLLHSAIGFHPERAVGECKVCASVISQKFVLWNNEQNLNLIDGEVKGLR